MEENLSYTSDKLSAAIIAGLLRDHGVRHVFISPGSRNTPLTIALARTPGLECLPVIDERSAAFMALGASVRSGEPVAVCCTSGTALLNYAPAVAEAYYRRVPLIVISADRPEEWIDQDDSQTLWQQNALEPYVKRSCDISARLDFDNGEWWVNRVVNDLLIEAVSGQKGPVHINVRLDNPLDRTVPARPADQRRILRLSPERTLTLHEAKALAENMAAPRRVMVIAGFMPPDNGLNKALQLFASAPNTAVLSESISNLHGPWLIDNIDSVMRTLTPETRREMAPDLVITIGGALVSRMVKEWIRGLPSETEHWHIGYSDVTVDCFKHLSMRIDLSPASFFRQTARQMLRLGGASDYRDRWRQTAREARLRHSEYCRDLPWCDLKAFESLFAMIPPRWDLHLSNGTPIRYGQLVEHGHIHRTDCNRGVSGIDGCTSTALGASIANPAGVTLLVSGDMSFQYDIGALASPHMGPGFKMAVICNGGGGIFRFIPSTRSLPELERYFAVGTRLPLEDLCRGYGIAYFKAGSETELQREFRRFAAVSDRPALLAIHTPGGLSAEILSRYFRP